MTCVHASHSRRATALQVTGWVFFPLRLMFSLPILCPAGLSVQVSGTLEAPWEIGRAQAAVMNLVYDGAFDGCRQAFVGLAVGRRVQLGWKACTAAEFSAACDCAPHVPHWRCCVLLPRHASWPSRKALPLDVTAAAVCACRTAPQMQPVCLLQLLPGVPPVHAAYLMWGAALETTACTSPATPARQPSPPATWWAPQVVCWPAAGAACWCACTTCCCCHLPRTCLGTVCCRCAPVRRCCAAPPSALT